MARNPAADPDEPTEKEHVDPDIADDSGEEGEDSSEESGTTDSDTKPNPFVRLINLRGTEPTDSQIENLVHEAVSKTVNENAISTSYDTLIVFDPYGLARTDADKIYRALRSLDGDNPILLVLNSSGGSIPASYFIGKLCREYSPDKVVVAVPRRAKSGATLVCCGADEIHMGSLSELGPIDPQFEGVPALALKYSVEHIAELAGRYPEAAGMFATYLAKSLEIDQLGYYERVAESAVQYARRLLKNRVTDARPDDGQIAHRLVYSYKDHGFVIDANEAQEIFTDEVVNVNTEEYQLSNDLYGTLGFLEHICREMLGKPMYFTGAPGGGCNIITTTN